MLRKKLSGHAKKKAAGDVRVASDELSALDAQRVQLPKMEQKKQRRLGNFLQPMSFRVQRLLIRSSQ